MRRFLPLLFAFFLLLSVSPVWANDDLRESLLLDSSVSAVNGDVRDTDFRENFLATGLDYAIGILAILAVGMFLYTGYMLLMADGKEEEHKKAWISFLYIGIGLAVVPLSYVAVKIVLGININ
ncbi:MAG TPA: hypothetical protein PK765_03740 [bacterium]|nr:hypothetical protein [bacterium]